MKLAIVIAGHGRVTLEWAINLSQLIKQTSVPVEIFVSRHYELSKARQNGVMAAKNAGATHILCIDTDIIPCSFQDGKFTLFHQAINYILSFRYPCISGIYLSKKDLKPAVYDYTGDENLPFKITDKKFEDLVNTISFSDGCGLGFFLMDVRVLDVLKSKGYYPFFEYKTDYNKRIEISEDLYFCNLLRKCGFSIMILGDIVCLHEMAAKLYPNGGVEYASLSE
jgi:hypothetical protein